MEPSPRSDAPPKAATIKVSLDEYVVARRGVGAELMTDGLSGCVAVALKSGDRIGLTHVYSDALGRFGDYKEPLNAFARRVANGGQITEAYLVHNSNARLLGHDKNLPEMIGAHLVEQNLVKPWAVRELHDNGCALTDQGVFLKKHDNPAIYASGGHTNSALENLNGPLREGLEPLRTTGDLFRTERENVARSGFLGPCDLRAMDILPQANRPEAQGLPPLPPIEKADAAALPLDKSVRQQLLDSKLYTITATPVARAVTEHLQGAGFTAATLAISDGGKTIVASGDRPDMTFDVSGRSVALRATTAPVTLPDKPSLYEQAQSALAPLHERLGLKTDSQQSEAAREIASQASAGKLDRIDHIEVASPGGKQVLIAHEDNVGGKQSPPIEVDAIQKRLGIGERTPDVPTTERVQTM